VLLLPNYDEYLVAYTDRSDVFDPAHRGFLDARGEAIMQHVVVVDGMVAGTWRSTARAKRLEVTAALFAAPSPRVRAAIEEAVDAFGRHRDTPAEAIVAAS
jgi:hypothetical protein